jgi:hypothetical protein
VIKKLFSSIIVSLAVCLFLSPTNSLAGQATLAWDPPEISTDVTGYKIHYGTASGTYTQSVDAGDQTNYAVQNLTDGRTYYFVVTSYNAAAYESEYSNEVSMTVPPQEYPLTVSKLGSGQGTVSGSGINCGETCLASYSAGAEVTLSATAEPGSTFDGWSGGVCSGTGLCTVTMNANMTVTANFKPSAIQVGSLTVTTSGQWRRVGTTTWLNGGSTETGIPVGAYTVEFKSMTGWTTPSSVAVTISNGATATASGTYVQQVGSLRVTTDGQWRRVGTATWLNGGSTETGIPVGAYTVEFKPVAGLTTPSSVNVTISNGVIAAVSGTYVQQVGSLTVTTGVQWRRVGTTTWLNSGFTETGIPAGTYTVEFKPVTGGTTPSSVAVTISNGATATVSGTYVQQTVQLNTGWNWISFNVLPADTSLSAILGTHEDDVEQIKTQTDSVTRRNGSWIGNTSLMSQISESTMFKINVKQGFNLTVTGAPIEPDVMIGLNNGWTWVASLPAQSMNAETALSTVAPILSQIKSQTQSKTKVGTGGSFVGDLVDMEPGKGYMIKTSAAGILIYPASH